MNQLFEYVKMGIENILSHKGRSILTMLGIIIGVSSVIAIMSLGAAFKSQIGGTLDAASSGQVVIYTGEKANENLDYITLEDMEAIKEIDGIIDATGYIGIEGTATTEKGEVNSTYTFIGSGIEIANRATDEIVKGRYYTSEENALGKLYGVIKEEDSKKIFGSSDTVGLSFDASIYGQIREVTIIGVTREKESSNMLSFGSKSDSISVLIPFGSATNFGIDTNQNYMSYVFIDKEEDTKTKINEILDLLKERHNTNEDDYFSVQDIADITGMINSALDMITIFIALVAAISLIVGGIGVMNIMLVSVTERTREIGIRKALGAKKSSIITQFLFESAFIGLIGGIIGIILGASLAAIVCIFVKMPIVVTLSSVILASLVSMGIGILFGVYPANKAAKLSPMEALRRE